MNDTERDVKEADELFGNHGTNTQLMVMAAHRYCLGRMTYIVGACVEWMTANRRHFEANTVRVVLRDTIEAMLLHRAGMECDVRQWRSLVELLWNEASTEDRTWVRRQVSHRDAAGLLSGLGRLRDEGSDTMGDDDEGGPSLEERA